MKLYWILGFYFLRTAQWVATTFTLSIKINHRLMTSTSQGSKEQRVELQLIISNQLRTSWAVFNSILLFLFANRTFKFKVIHRHSYGKGRANAESLAIDVLTQWQNFHLMIHLELSIIQLTSQLSPFNYCFYNWMISKTLCYLCSSEQY